MQDIEDCLNKAEKEIANLRKINEKLKFENDNLQ